MLEGGVQEEGFRALTALAQSQSVKRLIGEEGGARSVIRGMRRHLEKASVQAAACTALWSLMEDGELIKGVSDRR
ncbi:hypothetical protein T484DRAFT_1801902 [Baffinella frigidus]|nr:hypothetical protein T484DRAFT_1801902 [Cryptophyta sp. CCMP2293]